MALLEALYRFVDTILCLSGILFNAILIYCVQNRSPKSIATYTFLLMNCGVSNLITGIVTLFVQPRVIIQEDNLYFIANGFCSLFGVPYCFSAYGVMINLYGNLAISQLASFIFRWYILHWSMPSKRTMAIVIFLMTVPVLFVFFAGTFPFIVMDCCNSFKAEISQIHPDLNIDIYSTFGIPHVDFRAAIPAAWILLPVIPITIFVFGIGSAISKHLEQHVNMHEQTRKMHKNLLKALTLQAFLPLFYLIGISLFAVDFLFQLHHSVTEYGLFFSFGWAPILSPLFPLYFVTPYRRFILGLFFKKSNKIDASSGNTNTALSNRSQRAIVIRY